MLIHELLVEAHLLSILKKNLKRVGTFDDVFGRLAAEAADAANEKPTASVLVVGGSEPDVTAAVQSVLGSRAIDSFDGIKIVGLPGSVRAIIKGGKVYFGEYQAGRLVD